MRHIRAIKCRQASQIEGVKVTALQENDNDTVGVCLLQHI